MWPWEHLAVGYLLYSGYAHLVEGRPPRHDAAVVAVVASQFPDLVDKPLAWGLSALPGGRTLGHSLVFGVPFLVAFALAARRADRPWLGGAAAVPYLSHVATDALYPALVPGETVSFGFLLWPFLRGGGSTGTDFLGRFTEVLSAFGTYATSPAGVAYLAFDAALVGAFLVLWVRDGLPGVAWALQRRRRDAE